MIASHPVYVATILIGSNTLGVKMQASLIFLTKLALILKNADSIKVSFTTLIAAVKQQTEVTWAFLLSRVWFASLYRVTWNVKRSSL